MDQINVVPRFASLISEEATLGVFAENDTPATADKIPYLLLFLQASYQSLLLPRDRIVSIGMHPDLSSFSIPCLGLKLAEALVIGNPTAIAPQTELSVFNVSLETEAGAQWNAEDFKPSSAQSIEKGSTLGANSSVPSLNTTLSTLVHCKGNDFGFDLNAQSCYDILVNPMMGMMDTTEKIWGPRNVGADKVLPLRYVSRKSITK